jgi:hypothetical protein
MALRAWVSLALMTVCAARAFAADEATPGTAPAAAPAAAAAEAPPALALTAYLDAAYAYLSGDGLFTSGAADRVFDLRRDAFTLQQAAVNAAYQPKEGFGGVVNLTAGDVAPVIRACGAPVQDSKFDLTQAYAQYATAGFTLMAGKFVTLAGAEVIASPADTNYSRSILFGYAEPFTHTGLRTSYAASDLLTLYLGVNNGWDDFKDTDSAKTLEAGVALSPSKTLSFAASGYFGTERSGGLVNTGPEGQRALVDLVATWALTEQLTLVANYDWGHQANALVAAGGTDQAATWNGLAGYVNYTFSDHWKTSVRTEFLDDAQGYRTGVPQTWHETTGTVAYLPSKFVELRAELRVDGSDTKAFQSAAGNPAANQQSAALQALFKY